MIRDVRLAHADFDPAHEMAHFTARQDAGGVTSFLGKVRSEASDNPVLALELRHYAPLTLPGMEELAMRAERNWKLTGLLIIHREGVMEPGDPIVLVACGARHRRDAFEASDFLMDHLKSESWFWKREKTANGWRWIEPRAQDADDLARWAHIR
ncbi:molybdenum cofactor biosynthesis protein MoaE [Croceicoccus mobilis]|uniref:Molybdopterin synthase catalytic subunit n=1 Tax=Croceicoccus mobilis TaxID=1703339 RepID=A0A916YZE0_9SPHN|nr:molybdenum cofactor biosynthesis protein MoaE [Croceicoccus mobilis]